MDGRKAVSSDILGLEVGRNVLRGVLLDAAGANVVNFAESPLPPTAGEPVRSASADCRGIGPSLHVLLSKLGLQSRPVFAAGLAVGPQFAGVGSGPALGQWLQSQADAMNREFVCAGELGIAFAPKDVVEAAVAIGHTVDLSLVRVDLAPVAAARVLIDPSQDVTTIGSGTGWRARLRSLEVVEAVERTDVGPDDPFQVRLEDGRWEPLTGYRRITIPPGLRAAGFDPAQMAVAVGVAFGVANRSKADLLQGTVVEPRLPANAVPETRQKMRASVPGAADNDPPSGRLGVDTRSPTSKRRPPVGDRRPSRVPAIAADPFTSIEDFSAEPKAAFDREQDPASANAGVDIMIGFLLALMVILVAVYLFL